MEQVYPDAISENNGQILIDKVILFDIDEELDTEAFSKEYFERSADFRKEYLKKTENDYSARDVTELMLNRVQELNHLWIPPIEAVSPESVEKKVRALFDTSEYKDSVYVRRSGKKGGRRSAV